MAQIQKIALLLAAAALLVLLSGCAPVAQEGGQMETTSGEVQETIKKAAQTTLDEQHLHDNPLLYAHDEDTSVVTMYLTVFPGNASENTDHTWKEINTYSVYDYEEMRVPRYQVAALLQVGDESGPLEGELGYGRSVPNATVQIRGQTSSRNAQKNYKIELKKNVGTWRGQETIALNKHMTDSLRFRNKLANDLLEEIDELMALRTQFVHLYVRDLGGEHPDEFEDYGLYTQIEQLNKTAMRAHGLDRAGYLYKINFFEFYRYEDIIKPETDPAFDRAAMDVLLETKGETSNDKLIRMLDALNDNAIPIDTVLDTYFDRENLCYWMAFEMLLGNAYTESRNIYLYSPLNGNRWYIIPWDHDAALMRDEWEKKDFTDGKSWQMGVSNYWGNVLFQRCLKSGSFRAQLDAAVEDLHSRFTEDRLAAMIGRYTQVIKPYAFSMPDVEYIGVTQEEYDALARKVPGLIERYHQDYLESLEKPMPFFVGVPKMNGGVLSLTWDNSYDFDAEDITYHVTLARDYLYTDVLFETETRLPLAQCAAPGPGQYFLKVTSTNESGYTQDCFDYYVTGDGKVYGTFCFYIMEDGHVEGFVDEE